MLRPYPGSAIAFFEELRNRVSSVDAKDNCDMPKRNPVSRLSARTQKPGFFCGCQR
ncbi:hypothetical protein [Planktothricoides sp. SR001]|uniref:hypothetical protein n=1 Tax=Planktothricoides sp. SR001 TaxID=1705388 RepID=UPI0012E0DD8D|nr:hypothetical protein [Planktothricoides sp. SR001]